MAVSLMGTYSGCGGKQHETTTQMRRERANPTQAVAPVSDPLFTAPTSRWHDAEHNGVIRGPAVSDGLPLDAYLFVSVVPPCDIEPCMNI